jgi:hypothetical protein
MMPPRADDAPRHPGDTGSGLFSPTSCVSAAQRVGAFSAGPTGRRSEQLANGDRKEVTERNRSKRRREDGALSTATLTVFS